MRNNNTIYSGGRDTFDPQGTVPLMDAISPTVPISFVVNSRSKGGPAPLLICHPLSAPLLICHPLSAPLLICHPLSQCLHPLGSRCRFLSFVFHAKLAI